MAMTKLTLANCSKQMKQMLEKCGSQWKNAQCVEQPVLSNRKSAVADVM